MKVAAAAVLLAPALAAAAPPDGGALPFIAHDGGSFVDLRGGGGGEGFEDGSRSAEGLDATAQLMLGGEVGVYGACGVAHGHLDLGDGFDPYTPEDTTTPLDLEAGAIYRLRFSDGSAITLDAGVSLPAVVNAGGGTQVADGFFALTDPVDRVRGVNRTAVRLGITPMRRDGSGLIVGGHLGVDVIPSYTDVTIVEFAGVIGGETRGGTSFVVAAGGNHIREGGYAESGLSVALELASRFGPAQIYAGARAGRPDGSVISGALVGGVRWDL